MPCDSERSDNCQRHVIGLHRDERIRGGGRPSWRELLRRSAMESWFSTFKSEIGGRFEGYAEAREHTFDFIEVFLQPARDPLVHRLSLARGVRAPLSPASRRPSGGLSSVRRASGRRDSPARRPATGLNEGRISAGALRASPGACTGSEDRSRRTQAVDDLYSRIGSSSKAHWHGQVAT
jgi:hypothetical protein